MFSKFIAIVLVALWPAVTSHSLLTHSGIIHVVHTVHDHDGDSPHHHHHQDEDSHEHNGDNHAVADGDYRSTSASKLILKPSLVAVASLLPSVNPDMRDAGCKLLSPGPAPPGSMPKILQRTWQFTVRAAIPGRAPSFVS